MFQDVAGDEGFIDARVFVGSEMLQCIFGDALMPCSFCREKLAISKHGQIIVQGELVPLLGGMAGVVTGSGKDMMAVGQDFYI
jgi:hypothetical protein